LFTVADLQKIPLLNRCFKSVDEKYSNIDNSRRIHEVLRSLFGKMVEDVIETSITNLSNFSFTNVDEIRMHEEKVVKFSKSMWFDLTLIREFLFNNMYRAPSVMLRRKEATKIVTKLFQTYLNDSQKMPDEWSTAVKSAKSKIELATIISDYIAGMTDRFAYQEAARLRIIVDNDHLNFV
jgi:dGTPase